jgi:hypothetical protein
MKTVLSFLLDSRLSDGLLQRANGQATHHLLFIIITMIKLGPHR